MLVQQQQGMSPADVTAQLEQKQQPPQAQQQPQQLQQPAAVAASQPAGRQTIPETPQVGRQGGAEVRAALSLPGLHRTYFKRDAGLTACVRLVVLAYSTRASCHSSVSCCWQRLLAS
jgi:hypothetical protein